jgi:hypothetical protein
MKNRQIVQISDKFEKQIKEELSQAFEFGFKAGYPEIKYFIPGELTRFKFDNDYREVIKFNDLTKLIIKEYQAHLDHSKDEIIKDNKDMIEWAECFEKCAKRIREAINTIQPYQPLKENAL